MDYCKSLVQFQVESWSVLWSLIIIIATCRVHCQLTLNSSIDILPPLGPWLGGGMSSLGASIFFFTFVILFLVYGLVNLSLSQMVCFVAYDMILPSQEAKTPESMP